MNKVKFSVFGDMHFSGGMFADRRGIQDDAAPPWWCGDCDERLDFIFDRAKKENVDFIIHCGDFTHNPRGDNRVFCSNCHTQNFHQTDLF